MGGIPADNVILKGAITGSVPFPDLIPVPPACTIFINDKIGSTSKEVLPSAEKEGIFNPEYSFSVPVRIWSEKSIKCIAITYIKHSAVAVTHCNFASIWLK